MPIERANQKQHIMDGRLKRATQPDEFLALHAFRFFCPSDELKKERRVLQ
jgi:hypothetical protein